MKFYLPIGFGLFIAFGGACKKDSAETRSPDAGADVKNNSPAVPPRAPAESDVTTDELGTLLPAGRAERKAAAKSFTPGSFFSSIPANTPYVFTSFEPFPAHVYASMLKWLPLFDTMLEQTMGAVTGDGEEERAVRAVLAELKGKLNAKGLESLGFSSTPEFAVYGLGPFPVMRLGLSSGARLRAAVERVFKRAKLTVPSKKIGKVEYWPIGREAVVAIQGDQLVAFGGNRRAIAKMLPVVLGGQKLDESMASGSALRKVASAHGFSPFGVGYVDFKAVYRGVLGEAKDLEKELWGLVWGRDSSVPAACKKELAQVLERFPGIALGYDRVTEGKMSFSVILEMEPQLVAPLRVAAARIPRIGHDKPIRGLMAMEVAGKLDVFRALSARFGRALSKVGAACDTSLTRTGKELQSIPGQGTAANDLLGVTAFVLDATATTGGGAPKDIEGYMSASSNDPAALLVELNKLVGQAGITLSAPADGAFHDVDAPLVKNFTSSVQIARTARELFVSAGKRGAEAAQKALATKPTVAPFFFVAYDAGKFADLTWKSGGSSGADKMVLDAMGEQLKKIGTVQMRVYPSPEGLAFTWDSVFNSP